MKLGVALPVIDPEVGGDPNAIRDFAQAAEEIGYRDLSVPDHVLGVNAASRRGGAIETRRRICFRIHSCSSAFLPAARGRSAFPRRC